MTVTTLDVRDNRRRREGEMPRDVHDETASGSNDVDVERISAELVDAFDQVARDEIEQDVRAEFGRWSSSPVQEFVPIFVRRAVRRKLRTPGMPDPG